MAWLHSDPSWGSGCQAAARPQSKDRGNKGLRHFFLCRLAPVLTLTAWLQPTYKVKMPAGGWKKLKAPQLRAACEERKIAVKPKEKPAAMVKKLAAFKG